MANIKENVNGKMDPGELPLFRCKYCSQNFQPEIAFDLHVMAKHPTQWGTQPFYPNSDDYSLASADLLKIVQREFGSLRKLTLQDVKSSVPPVILDPPKLAKIERSSWRSAVKRRLDADHDDRHSENGSLTNGLSTATPGRKIIRASSSTSTAESIGADLPTTSSASTGSTSTLSGDTAGTPSNDEDEHIAAPTRIITTYVAKDRSVNVRSEGRSFSNENNSKDPSRVGAAENALLSGSNLSTTIASGGSDADNELASLQRKQMNSSDRQLISAFRVIGEICERIHLAKSIKDQADAMCKQVLESKQLKLTNPELLAPACLLVLCRKEGVPHTFKEICAVSRVGKKEIGRYYKLILKAVDTLHGTEAKSYGSVGGGGSSGGGGRSHHGSSSNSSRRSKDHGSGRDRSRSRNRTSGSNKRRHRSRSRSRSRNRYEDEYESRRNRRY